jgi:hypothetical protein
VLFVISLSIYSTPSIRRKPGHLAAHLKGTEELLLFGYRRRADGTYGRESRFGKDRRAKGMGTKIFSSSSLFHLAACTFLAGDE